MKQEQRAGLDAVMGLVRGEIRARESMIRNLPEQEGHLRLDEFRAGLTVLEAIRPPDGDGGFCTACGVRVDSFGALDRCPACGTKGVPCAWGDQVAVSINWHELRVLVMWAENYARAYGDAPGVTTNMRAAVYAIAKRISDQHPEAGPLTMASEVAELAREVGNVSVSDPKLRRDVAEQEGVETGLIRPPVREDGP